MSVRELVITLGFLLACGQQRSESKPMEQPTKTQPAGLTLELALGPPVDNRFGLVVPELRLTIRNTGSEEADIPEPGISMMLSLRTTLVRGSETERRAGGTGRKSSLTGSGTEPISRPPRLGEACSLTW